MISGEQPIFCSCSILSFSFQWVHTHELISSLDSTINAHAGDGINQSKKDDSDEDMVAGLGLENNNWTNLHCILLFQLSCGQSVQTNLHGLSRSFIFFKYVKYQNKGDEKMNVYLLLQRLLIALYLLCCSTLKNMKKQKRKKEGGVCRQEDK